jgi:CRP-like cAMP-binding protein
MAAPRQAGERKCQGVLRRAGSGGCRRIECRVADITPQLVLHLPPPTHGNPSAAHRNVHSIFAFPRLKLDTRIALGLAMEIGRPYSRLLHRLEKLQPLSSHDRQLLSGLPLTVANLSASEAVARAGDSPSRCTLVLSGLLYSHKRVNGSRRQITSFFVPGDIADLQTLHLARIDHTLSTLGPAVVAFMPHDALRDVLRRSSQLCQVFWRDTFLRLAILDECVTNLGRRDAMARVAHVTCELAARLKAVDLAHDHCFAIAWTQADLADACGISSVHANRVVQELRRLGLVEWDPRTVRIRNWDALVKIGNFSEDYLRLGGSTESNPTTTKMPEHA